MASAVSEGVAGSRRVPPLWWLLPACVWYALLLCAGGGGLTAPVPHGLVFNSMALHLLHGQFDVDPAAIGDEGYLRDGLVYAYFGIFPALSRMLLLPLAEFATTDFTRVACLSAVAVMALFKVLSVELVARRAAAANGALVTLLLVVILAGGAQIEFLRPSIFQEVGLWAAAWAAVFVYLFLRGWSGDAGFSPRLMSAMAAVAGMCLLTRVSTALGLYLALGFLWLVVVWRDRRWRQVAPIAILLGFAAMAGAINLARWGNPLVFADLSRALIGARFPDRLARLHRYGEFNLARLPFGLSYYLFPIWALPELIWTGFRDRMFDSVELPPASFLVSDPLLVALAVYGAIDTARRRDRLVLPVLLGFLVPIGLMLTAISLTFRYRLEFYPFLELAAFVGFAHVAGMRRGWLAVGAVVSVVMAQAMWVLTMLSPFGPVQSVVGPAGVAAFYRGLF
ncbi:MAG TPA: hypothetical protein VGG57_13720 [Stellaceae bacterium]|jgi:hypothetical protein